jgi:signal transduction histidine kinase
MNTPIHILHLEDDANDAELVEATLKGGGLACAITWVKSLSEMVAALEHGGVDLIVSDSGLPDLDGMSALQVMRGRWPAIPVIFVSGKLGEERAVEALKNGATDYVLKDHLSLLPPAVRRAMLEVAERTERKRLEAQFIEAQKLEVIGQLAGGVAHDFNNIIGIIMGYSDLVMAKLNPDDPLQEDMQTIRQTAERAAGLTRQLLIFSRKQTVQATLLDLNHVVSDMKKMLRRVIGENVELKYALGKQIGGIKADSGYVDQVLLNMVVNARDAMPNGGKITVETADAVLTEDFTRRHPNTVPGNYVTLAISDTGTGLTEEVKARMFEAFFTTKPKGKGTGLGLATCQTIVKQCGGCIDVVSDLGAGTTFRVYFPRVEKPAEPGAKVVSPAPLPRGTETLLVVEDEPTVRHLACQVLGAQGYEVLSASNGQEGLQIARQHQGDGIKLVVTDVIMPQMGGKLMAEWLKFSYPDLKVLFTSGYTHDNSGLPDIIETGVAFLPKPYTPAGLARAVRESLDHR